MPGAAEATAEDATDTGSIAPPLPPADPAASFGQVEPLEVVVKGRTVAERLRGSAEAVTVVELEKQRRESADLGEILARTRGITLRRSGALGSPTRLSLNGLTDEQIRYFLDGLPLTYSGYLSGIANIPINFVERIEVYRGVAPIRFGADALGGVVNVVTLPLESGSRAAASYQTGSFGTRRATVSGAYRHRSTGWFMRPEAFIDAAENDYTIQVEVPDERGRLSPAEVRRFHDGYRAAGVTLETGVLDRDWADRFSIRGFANGYEKELQHNVVMAVPYGDAQYGGQSVGGSAHYEQGFGGGVRGDFALAYAHVRTDFLDVGECVYDWFGQCVRERRQPGEIEGRPRDQSIWDDTAFGRLNLSWLVHPQHSLRVSVSPTVLTRTGDERRQLDPDIRDPLTAQRDLFSVVSGAEYEVDILDNRLENIVFAKDYLQFVRSEEPLPGNVFRRANRDTHRLGLGNALRYRIDERLYAKTSYEWTTRLPRPEEIFGDGLLVVDNLELEPEVSHNVNLGLTVDADTPSVGHVFADINGFLRETEQLIVLLGNNQFFIYENVYNARAVGIEAAATWTSVGEHFSLGGNVTYQDVRNTSSQGTFGNFVGDRIPNRSPLTATGTAALQFQSVVLPADELTLSWYSRYVHEFFRSWESVGLVDFKDVIPSQLIHSLVVTYFIDGDRFDVSFTAEGQNITNELVFDFYGVQRPGRAFFLKTVVNL